MRYKTMKNKLSILIVLPNILWFIQCFSVKSAAGGDVVNDVNYSIFNSAFNATQQKLHTIKVSNEMAAPFGSSETHLYFLLGNELHWINDASTLVKLGSLVDFRDEKHKLNFVQIQASRWNNQIIFMADVEHNYYVYVISMTPKGERESKLPAIVPIQKLKKHKLAQTIDFFHFEENLYCLLGSTDTEERRSELRFLKWSRSYFQIIETIVNRNHAIDMVMVSARQNLILIVHNKVDNDDDTTIQVHRYQALDKAESALKERELITERVQDIFLPYALTPANMFLYSDTSSLRLYLTTCNGPVLTAVPNDLCEFYAWKRDGIAESTRFQRLQRFPLSEAIANVAEGVQVVSNDTTILNLDSLLAIKNGDSIYTFNGQADSRLVNVSQTNLIGNFLEKRLTPDSKLIASNLISIYQEPDTQNGTINIEVRTLELFEEKLPDVTVATPNVPKAGDVPKTSGDIAMELSRIKELLLDLRGHLISENEQFLKPMQSKIADMKEALRMRQVLKNGTFGPEPISIYTSELKITGPTNETYVNTIMLNADQNDMNASLAETYERIKKINIVPAPRAKRTVSVQETLHVRRLTVKSDNHPFKGMLLKNTSSNTYHLNGKIKTRVLRLSRVSGNDTTNVTTDSIVGNANIAGNFHKKIQVKSINGANWDDFVSSLYRKGRNTPINGNIILTHPASIRRLFTHQLNGVSPNDYLTIGTDQQIDSNMFITSVHVNEVQSNVINNMQRFAEYVALIGQDNIVDTRVKIAVCNISNSLQLSDKEGEEMTQHIVGTRMEDLSQIYNGKITIKGSLSLQNVELYNVNDNGSPFAPILPDPTTAEPAAQVVIDGTPFNLRSVPQQYWMKSLDQNFADVTFTQPITVPQLNADFLLTHPTNEYFVLSEKNDSPEQLLPLNVIFDGETFVAGDLFSTEPMSTTLQQLSLDAVRRGRRVTMSKPVTFSGHVFVDDVGMVFNTDQFVRRNRPAAQPDDTLFGKTVRKEFASTVSITGDLRVVSDETADITVDNFNGHQALRKHFDAIVLIDRPQSVSGTLIFDANLFSNNLTVSAFIDNAGRDTTSEYDNHIELNELLAKIFNFRENQIELLKINGNVRFAQSDQLTVNTLNGISLSNYLSLVALQQQSNETIPIYGTKTFASDVTMEVMSVSSFNRQIYVDDWMAKSLRLQKTPGATQVIDGGGWVIDTLIADNVEIRGTINGLRMPIKNHPPEFSDVIVIDDTDPQQPINIWSTLLLTQGMEIGPYGDLSSSQIANCDVHRLFTGDSIDLTHTTWDTVTILGEAIIPPPTTATTPQKSISEFFRDAVVSGKDQLIGGNGRNVTLKSNGKIVFNRIQTIASIKSQQPLINGVNLIDLYADAVTKTIVSVDGETQPIFIEGKKEFLNEYVTLNGPETLCAENLIANNVNDVDILALNETIIRRDAGTLDIKDGHKLVFMKSMKIERLTMDAGSTINGVGLDDIFFIYDKTKQPPRIAFARHDDYNPSTMCVHVMDNLSLDTVNELSLKYFLENRVRKYVGNGAATASNSDLQLVYGHLTFDNLVVSGTQTKIETINDVLCNDVVILPPDNNDEPQVINGFKEIIGDLNVYQPFHTTKINGIDVRSSYGRTVFLDQNQTLEQLSIHEPYRVNASVLNVRRTINGIALPNDVEYSVVPARSHSAVDDDDEDVDKVGAEKGVQERTKVGAEMTAKTPGKKATPSHLNRLNYIDESNDFAIAFNATSLFDANNVNDLHSKWLSIDSLYSEMVDGGDGRKDRLSMCPLQYHIQSEERGPEKRQWLVVRRAAIGERLLTLNLNPNYVVHIHTEFPPDINYYEKCNFELHQCNGQQFESRIQVNYKDTTMRYPNEYIENAHIFQLPQMNQIYLIVHLFNSSVQIMRSSMLDEATPWTNVQSIPLITDSAAPMIFNVKYIEWQHCRVLIIAQSRPSGNRERESSLAERLAFYRFNETKEQFEPFTTIEGDFNIISTIPIDQRTANPTARFPTLHGELHLILAKKGERVVEFWKADEQTTTDINFHFERKLKLEGGIESLSTFAEYDLTYLSIILNDGRFLIYQYRARDSLEETSSSAWSNMRTSSWQKKLAGHFGSGKALVPFTASEKLYLLVFMSEKTANLRVGGRPAVVNGAKANEIAKIYTLYYY